MTRSLTSNVLRSAVVGLLVAGTVGGCGCDPELASIYPVIQVNPTELDFGAIPIGAVTERYVEVTNAGRATLNIASAAVSENDAEIAVAREWTQDCTGAERTGGANLGPSECARFFVRVKPNAAHAVVGKITIQSDDGNNPSVDVNITGTGVISGIQVCLVNPETGNVDPNVGCTDFTKPEAEQMPALKFGPVPLNDSLVRKVRVNNIGEGPLVVLGASVEVGAEDNPDFALANGQTFNATILKAASADIEVQFAPLGGDGPVTATLVIPNNDPAHPVVRVPLTADIQGPRLCVLPETGLDFGSVIVNTTRTLSLDVQNCGQVPYNLTRFEFAEDDTGTIEYTLEDMPVVNAGSPKSMPPGERFKVQVTYSPHRVTPDNGNGDLAHFSIITEYQRGSIPVVGKGGTPGCEGGAVPTADIRVFAGTQNITTNPTAEPLATVILDGSTSTIGSGRGTPVYAWRLVSQPTNGNTNISGTGAKPRLFLELAGDYVVELVVKDQFGCQSSPKQITLHSVPKGKLHVQLTWPESYGDVDLHYLGPGGTFFDGGSFFGDGSDVFYQNKTPDWGKNNTTQPDGNRNNDASLDIDTLWGNGPENVNHDLPFDGTYKIVVAYYCSRQFQGSGYSSVSSGPANARIKVYVNGVEKLNITKALTQRDVWEVARVTVSGNGTNIAVAPLSVVVRKTSASDQACTSAVN